MIVFVCEDKEFANRAGQLITQELALPCAVADSYEQVRAKKAMLVLSSKVPEDTTIPFLLLTHPCYMPELITKIEQTLRVAEQETPIELAPGYLLSLRSRQLTHQPSGESCALTDKEAALLQQLQAAGASGCDKETLLQEVWGIEEDGSTRTLETHIHRLRSKLKALISGEDAICLSEGKYRLVL